MLRFLTITTTLILGTIWINVADAQSPDREKQNLSPEKLSLSKSEQAGFNHFLNAHMKFIREGEIQIQNDLPEYRLLYRVETFDERLNATHTYEALSIPAGSIAVLHDFHTGEPLQSCKSPCTLNVSPTQSYHITHYKMGHVPHIRVLEPDDLNYDPIPKSLGINFMEAYLKGLTCYRDFMKTPNKPDQDITPCHRAPPFIPPGTDVSGFCIAVFDVNKYGRTENIKATECTHENFVAQSEGIVQTWSYTPKIERGEPVTQTGVKTKLTYRIMDKTGALLPGPPGALPKENGVNPAAE